jgi:hypothetical protein
VQLGPASGARSPRPNFYATRDNPSKTTTLPTSNPRLPFLAEALAWPEGGMCDKRLSA